MIKLGGILTLSSIIVTLYNPDSKTRMYLGLKLMLLLVVILFLHVEKAINKKFNIK